MIYIYLQNAAKVEVAYGEVIELLPSTTPDTLDMIVLDERGEITGKFRRAATSGWAFVGRKARMPNT